ncbi:MAG: TatD family hydrolase, partial [Pseudomonadota bacterium]
RDYPALLHCYTSGEELADWATEAGLYFSVSGIASFKNAHDVRARIKAMPDDRIMLETDCPYLAPVPHRGKRNEPAFLPFVADALADVKGWTREETDRRTTDAFFALFKKAA